MNPPADVAFLAFEGDRHLASGDLGVVARAAKEALDRRPQASILIFDGITSEPVDLDFRGSVNEMLARLAATSILQAPDHTETEPPVSRGPGRPKLGVVAREITLLPRHWQWLGKQKGGASVAIRKLVDEARRTGEDADRIRDGQEATYRFMSAMAGNRPHFEEATRALFAPDRMRFERLIAAWPADVRDHVLKLAARALPGSVDPATVSR